MEISRLQPSFVSRRLLEMLALDTDSAISEFDCKKKKCCKKYRKGKRCKKCPEM